MSDVLGQAGAFGGLVMLGAVVGLVAAGALAALGFTKRRVPLTGLVAVPIRPFVELFDQPLFEQTAQRAIERSRVQDDPAAGTLFDGTAKSLFDRGSTRLQMTDQVRAEIALRICHTCKDRPGDPARRRVGNLLHERELVGRHHSSQRPSSRTSSNWAQSKARCTVGEPQ